MNSIERFFWGHMLVTVAALAIGYALSGFGICSTGLVLVGLVWLVAQQRRAEGIEGLMIFVFVIASGAGLYFGNSGWLMLVAVVSSLGAWDLYYFLQRLGSVDQVEFGSGLGREHLRRLGLVELVGLTCGMAGFTFHQPLGFWWEIFLVLLAVIGLAVLVRRIRRETE